MAVQYLETLIVPALTVAGDNIIAQGSNANGNWVRFAGGLQVCYGLYDLGTFNINTAAGASFVSGFYAPAWAAGFFAAPYFEISPMGGGGLVWSSTYNSDTSNGFFRLLSTSAQTGLTFDVRYLAIGRWK